MQLFSRVISLNGPLAEVSAWAADMREYVSGKSGREFGLWAVMFGGPIGTMVYSARVDGLADLQSIGEALVSDPEYHAKLASGSQYSGGPPVDQISTPIYGDLGDPPPVGSVAVVTTATMANGAYVEAIAWGVDMAQYVETVTGLRSTFLVDDFGPFGQVRWIGVAPSAGAADAASQKLNADPGYLDKLGAAGTLFAEGSGQRGLVSRVA
jgi:hypothetical protein